MAPGHFRHGILRIENFKHALHSRRRALERPRGVAQLLERLVEHRDVGEKKRELPDGQPAVEDVERRDVEHERQAQRHHAGNGEGRDGVGDGEVQIRRVALPRLALEFAHLVLLLPEGVDDADAGQPLAGAREHVAFLLLQRGRLPPHARGEKINREPEQRQDQQRHARQHRRPSRPCRENVVSSVMTEPKMVSKPRL